MGNAHFQTVIRRRVGFTGCRGGFPAPCGGGASESAIGDESIFVAIRDIVSNLGRAGRGREAFFLHGGPRVSFCLVTGKAR